MPVKNVEQTWFPQWAMLTGHKVELKTFIYHILFMAIFLYVLSPAIVGVKYGKSAQIWHEFDPDNYKTYGGKMSTIKQMVQ